MALRLLPWLVYAGIWIIGCSINWALCPWLNDLAIIGQTSLRHIPLATHAGVLLATFGFVVPLSLAYHYGNVFLTWYIQDI